MMDENVVTSHNLYGAIAKVNTNPEYQNQWVRVREYNSKAGASVAISNIKKGVTYLPVNPQRLLAFTARTIGEKSRLYVFCMTELA